MKVGIIGSGGIARVHGPLIMKQHGTEIVGIADTDTSRARSLAAELDVDRVYSDAEVMIEEERPDLVHVLTPPQAHADLSVMAMEKGCHVLVEKPMALSLADAKRMVDSAKSTQRKLCVVHSKVFEGVIQRAIGLAADGAVGEPVSVEASYAYDSRRSQAIYGEGAERSHWSYRLNGGPLQDLMPHPASLVMEFISQIEKVHCIGRNRGEVPEGWQDEIRVMVESGSVTGYIDLSLNERPDTIALTIKGTKGVIHADLFNNTMTLRGRSKLPRAVDRGLSGFQLASQYLRQSVANTFRFATGRIDDSGGIGPLIHAYYEAIRNGEDSPVSPEKSLLVVELMTKVWPAPPVEIRDKPVRVSRSSRRKPTALVTGGTGFIGTHLIQRLRAEHVSVRVLVRPNSIRAGRLDDAEVDIAQGDLADTAAVYEATRGIDTVYHAGASTGNDWEESYRSTVKGTDNLIRAAVAHGVKRFVHLSSLAVYDLSSPNGHRVIDESSPLLADAIRFGPYARAKVEAERLIFSAYHDHGLGTTVVRPGIVIGPLGRIFFPHLGVRYKDKLLLVTRRGKNILPLTYVDNTIDGIYRASISDSAIGQAYNLVDDGEVSAKDYIDRFIQVTGSAPRIVSMPYALPYLASLAYEIAAVGGLAKGRTTSRAQLQWKQAPVRFDNSKAQRELSWKQSVGLEDGLTATFEWYAQRKGV